MARIVRKNDARLPHATLEAARDREDEQARAFVELVKRVEREVERIRAEERESTPRLALALAEKLVSAELADRPELVAHIVDESVSRLSRATRIVVRLHPSDVDLAPPREPWHEVVADESLSRGDCIVESNVGRVDARMRTRIESLRAVLGIVEGA